MSSRKRSTITDLGDDVRVVALKSVRERHVVIASGRKFATVAAKARKISAQTGRARRSPAKAGEEPIFAFIPDPKKKFIFCFDRFRVGQPH